MTDANAFKIPVTNYLGMDSQDFKSELLKICYTDAKAYYEIRKNVSNSVKRNVIQGLYNHLFQLLTVGAEGTLDGGVGRQIITYQGQALKPSVPLQRVNEMILGIATTLQSVLDSVIEEILPLDYSNIIQARLRATGNANPI